jgi:hypothetical protein
VLTHHPGMTEENDNRARGIGVALSPLWTSLIGGIVEPILAPSSPREMRES